MKNIIGDYYELAVMPEIKAALALIAVWALEMVGHPETAVLALFYLMLADLALGFLRAWKNSDLRGQRITRGAFKFFRYWLAIALFVWVDAAILKAVPIMPILLCDAFIAYLAINEVFSCINHLAFFGMPVPEAFLKRLHHYRDTITAAPGGSEEPRARDGEK